MFVARQTAIGEPSAERRSLVVQPARNPDLAMQPAAAGVIVRR
jgi:hypothetical protein